MPRREWAVAGALATAYLAILLGTVESVGFTRDEGYYFRAADHYLGWFEGLAEGLRRGELGESFRDPVIVRYWSYNREHPVLLKTLFGLSWKLFHAELGWLGDSTAYRLPAMALAAGAIFLTYLFAAEAYGARVALFAALALATIPRLFHDSHLACFDVGIMSLELLVVYSYWKGLGSIRWSILAGVAFGLALATKHNAAFIPLVLAAHDFMRRLGGGLSAREARGIPLSFAAIAVLGPLVFYLHWPYLWHDPVGRFSSYLQYHVHHEHYPVEYFGRVLFEPPFPKSFALVMTWVTVPFALVTLMTIACLRGLVAEALLVVGRGSSRDVEPGDPRRTRLLLLLAGIVPLLVMTLPGVPIFGGVKHWFTALPPLAILAAVELDRLLLAVRRPSEPWSATARLAYGTAIVAALLPGVLGIRLVHPYGIGFYNELLGGVRGGAEHGMYRNFWGYTIRGNLAYLNEHVEPGGRVFFHRTNFECFEMYRREGWLRSDIGYAPRLEDADWAIFHHQRPYADDEYRIWNDWQATRPVAGVYVDEVPMNLVYRRAREAR